MNWESHDDTIHFSRHSKAIKDVITWRIVFNEIIHDLWSSFFYLKSREESVRFAMLAKLFWLKSLQKGPKVLRFFDRTMVGKQLIFSSIRLTVDFSACLQERSKKFEVLELFLKCLWPKVALLLLDVFGMTACFSRGGWHTYKAGKVSEMRVV